MKILSLFIFFILLTNSFFAQVSFYWEPIAFHNYETLAEAQGDEELFSLSSADTVNNSGGDHITWRLYVEFDSLGNDTIPEQVLSITGAQEGASNDGFGPLFFDFSCCFYQHPQGAVLGSNISSVGQTLFPSLQYDSWVTIGVDSDTLSSANLSANGIDWRERFETGCELRIDDLIGGGWLNANNSPNGTADSNNRVLIAQFTIPVNCELSNAQLCLQYQVDGIQSDSTSFVDCVEVSQPDDCFTFPIFTEVLNVEPVSCYDGNDGLIQVISNVDPSNLEITINTTDFTDAGYGIFGDLSADEYVVTFTDLITTGLDGFNCLTTEIITINQPETPFLENEFNVLITPIDCPDACSGIIDLDSIMNIGYSASIVPSATFDNNAYIDLCTDSYEISIVNDLGCVGDTIVELVDPNDFIVNHSVIESTCADSDNGVVTISASGGTAPYEYCLNTNCNDTGEFTDLVSGPYIYSIMDNNDCSFTSSDPITITEPNPIEITELSVTPPLCGGDCTALASTTVIGGTPVYTFSWNGNPALAGAFVGENLCGGDNLLRIIDQNNCILDFAFNIPQPQAIEIFDNVTNTTCTDMCDGSFQVVAVGLEPLTIDYGALSAHNLTNLCEGDYPLVVTDVLGCIERDTITVGTDITSNLEYTVFTTPVSCWNESDGTATVAATGGVGEITYLWSDVNLQETATAIGLKEDFYTITITDEMGCTFSQSLFIEPTEGCFFIANALTPNGDGFNDEWVIGGLEYFPQSKVEVFNRWGQHVYESIGSYTGWDGKLNGNKLPIADYYYIISYDPNSPPLTGTVTIKY